MTAVGVYGGDTRERGAPVMEKCLTYVIPVGATDGVCFDAVIGKTGNWDTEGNVGECSIGVATARGTTISDVAVGPVVDHFALK